MAQKRLSMRKTKEILRLSCFPLALTAAPGPQANIFFSIPILWYTQVNILPEFQEC